MSRVSRRLISTFRFRIGLHALLAVTVAATVYSQEATTGRVVGTVRDASEAVLPGATVVLASDEIMGEQTFVTDERGQYRFASLPPGMYQLTFTLPGFGTTRRTDVRVRVGAVLEENVTLQLGQVAETITVQASAVVVDTKSTKIETNYDREWIDNSPNQRRSFMDIVASAPGVEFGNDQSRVQPVSYGSNVDQNLYQLDGIDLTDGFNGNATTLVQPSIDTIEQIEVLSLGAPAEYGWHEGAVFNVVTRQGSNEFNGGAAFYYQHDKLTGRNTSPELDGGNPFTRVQYNNVTAQLGGPIVQDRLWFFAAYEHLRDSSVVLRIPEAAGFEDLDHYFAKFNLQITPNQQLRALVNYDRREQDFGLFPGEAPETAEGTGRDLWTPSVTYTAIAGQDTLVEAQYAGFFVVHNCCAAGGGGKGIATRFENLDTGAASGAIFGFYEYHVDKTSISAKVSHHASDFLNSAHDFKFGVQWKDAPAEGIYGVNDRVYTNDYLAGYGYDYTPYAYGGTVKSVGAFIDDSIQVNDRLQLNLGVRFDNTRSRFTDQPVTDALGNPTSEIVSGFDVYTWNTVSPRFGLNLTLTEDGKTVLKSHYGRYYRGGNTGEWVAAAAPTRRVAFVGDWNFATSSFENSQVAFSPSNASVDPDMKPAKTDQFIVSLERELFGNVNVGANYVLKRGRDLSTWRDTGGIYAPIPYVDDVGAEASGDTITIFQLQNSRADRAFLLTTGENTRADVDAFSVTATKRMTTWQLTSSLTFQRATSANIFGETAQLNFREFGRDPNDLVNSEGLAVRNRDVLAKAQFLYTGLPWDFTLGINWNFYTGYPTRREVRIAETGLNSRVQTEPRTDGKRFPNVNLLDLRIQKDIPLGRGDGVWLHLIANVFNVFNNDAVLRYRSDLATSEIFHAPRNIVDPRRVMLGIKIDF